MLDFLMPQGRHRRQMAADMYKTVVVQSRLPVFYERGKVPDTVDGRFEMIALHGALVIGRLCDPDMGSSGPKMAQAVFDAMFRNLEWSLREMGVGDLSVPRHVRRMMSAFKGRSFAYSEAGKAGRGSMIHALRRNVYATCQPQPAGGVLEQMASYADDVTYTLRQIDAADIRVGRISFPEPHLHLIGVIHEQKAA